MRSALKVLIVEDRLSDVELMLHVLRDDGFVPDYVRVETEADYRLKLLQDWDVILSDYSLPQLDARRALELLQESGAETPFIIVTGSISEEVAVECMKQGATDYLLKDRLTRLGPAVRRALEERQLRQQRREVELQLRQSQKMEGIGRLAGGIAHDFNNLLTIISGYTEKALAHVDPGNAAVEELHQVQAAADRARNLTQQILAFSRKQVLEKRVLNLNTEVESMGGMLRRLIGEDIEVRTHLAPDLGAVKADPSQIQQVLLNLAVNARDAMPRGGTMTLMTSNVELDAPTAASLPSLQPGEHVVLSVEDDGTGMPPETLSHIFEPFFTTKPPGTGTGLGLATVFGIVKQHGGHIAVSSTVGRGTTFQIYLPRTHEAAKEARGASAEARARRRPGTIMVAEDESVIRDLIASMLEGDGHRVLAVGSPALAEQAAAAHSGPIDLLVTDVVLPGMRGPDLHRRLRVARPDLKVLYISGYADDVISEGEPIPPQAFLQKPFRLRELSQRIDELLEG